MNCEELVNNKIQSNQLVNNKIQAKSVKMSKTLKLVLTDHWFEEIKSGRKTHEYRKATSFWKKRLWDSEQLFENVVGHNFKPYKFVEFQKAYRKNPERMTFTIKKIDWLPWGLKTDLHCNEPVFDIELGRRVK